MKTIKLNGIRGCMLFAAVVLWLLLPVGPGKVSAATQINLNVSGGQDISVVLQEELDRAKNDTSGQTYRIVIPAGSYRIGRILKIYSNTCLSMNGVTLVRSGCNDSMLRFGRSDDGEHSGYSGYRNITFEGGVWDSAGADKKAIMRLAHARNVTFSNVTFTNVRNNHHVEMAACKDVTFSGCTFSNFSGNLTSSTNYEALQMDIMHNKSHFSNYGKYDDTPCANITVTGCTFSGLQRGVGSHSAVAGSYFTNMVFTNNVFENISGYAVVCTNYRNATISGNTIRDCGSGIFFRSMVQNHSTFYTPLSGGVKIARNASSTIANNSIEITAKGYPNVAFGVSLFGENVKKAVKEVPKGNYILEGVTVQGNTISLNCSGYGIWLQNCNKNKILGNAIVCNIKSGNGKGNGDGIRLLGSAGNRVEKNRITNKVKSGRGKNMCGISILEKSNKTAVKGNTVTGAGKDGIAVKESTNVTVRSNSVTKSGRYGLNVTDKATVKMKSNSIKKNKKDTVCSRGAKVNGKTKIK